MIFYKTQSGLSHVIRYHSLHPQIPRRAMRPPGDLPFPVSESDTSAALFFLLIFPAPRMLYQSRYVPVMAL